MKRLIFVHGRSQQNLDPVKLKQEWRDALDTGLANIGMSLPEVESVCFPYYGDSLNQLDHGVSQGSALPVLIRSAGPEGIPAEEQELLAEWLRAAASQPQVASQLLAEGIDPVVLNRDIQNWPVVLGLAKALSHVPGVDVDTIALATHDVYTYLREPRNKSLF